MSSSHQDLQAALGQLHHNVERIEPGQASGLLTLLTQLNEALNTHTPPQNLLFLHVSDTMTTGQVASLLGVSLPTLRRMRDRGEIRGHKVGTHLRFSVADVRHYQQARRQQEHTMNELCALSLDIQELEEFETQKDAKP